MIKIIYHFAFSLLFFTASCNDAENKKSTYADKSFEKGSFGYDLAFLKKYHKDLVLLGEDSAGPQIIVLPAYQGRIMTSSASGKNGKSFGWVNHELIASGKFTEHMNAYGGEDRFWLGPEGGQFSIYFKKGVPFTFDNWHVPKEIDREAFTLISTTNSEALFKKEMHLENYSGHSFDLEVNRTIRLLNKQSIDSVLNMTVPGEVQAVAFESDNTIINQGANAWDKKSGMLSIWILSMFNATDKTTIAVPYAQDDSVNRGKIVTDDYFGQVPADRLKVKDGYILLKADALYRSKIGVSPSRALPLAASFDGIYNVLTISQFTLHAGMRDYVNSLWQIQPDPFSGDAVNAYNDGPINGKQMGRFYELESSSPAAALAPGETMQHLHRTIHLKGSKVELNKIALKLLGKRVDDLGL